MGKKYSYLGNYGLVKIIKGKFKGRFGYYDDDDIDFDGVMKSVIYFGEMLNNSNYYYIEQENITDDFTIEDLIKRKNEIRAQLWQNISDHKRLGLIEEKELIDGEICGRFENYLESSKLKNKKVFLSHALIDKDLVISVALDLNEKGITSWPNAFDILSRESVVSKANQGLENCKFILLFLSKHSVSSKRLMKEWEKILQDDNFKKGEIILIKLEECEIPKMLQTKKCIDFSNDYNSGMKELLNTIKEHDSKIK